MNKLALFDCDGTLVDSQHNIIQCMDAAFVRAGLVPPTRAATRQIVGLSLVPAMQALLPAAPPALHKQLAEDYKTAFLTMRAKGDVDEPLFDGIVAALDALEAAGWLLGVATGKSDRGLDLCLRHHGLRDRFVTLQTADRHPSKPHPSMAYQAMAEAGAAPHNSIMIGDTSFDMAMGRAAGARSLGVDWGYHDADDLWAAGAFHIASHPDQIIEAIQ
jgi:phosphoglycolate phosphatase